MPMGMVPIQPRGGNRGRNQGSEDTRAPFLVRQAWRAAPRLALTTGRRKPNGK